MRARLQRSPVMLPTWGWPDDNDPGRDPIDPELTTPAQPGPSARLALAGQAAARQRARRASGRRPIRAPGDRRRRRSRRSSPTRPTVFAGYQAIAARHQHALDRMRNARQILFRANFGRVQFAATADGRLDAVHEVFTTFSDPDEPAGARSRPEPFLVQVRPSGRRTRTRRSGSAEGDRDPADGERVMAEPNVLQSLAGEATKFFAFVGEALRPQDDPDGTKRPSIYEQALRKDLGLPPAYAPVAFSLPQDKLDAIKTYQSASNPSAEAGAQALPTSSSLIDALAGIVETWFHDGGIDPGAGTQQLAHSLLDVFASNYARLRFPRLFLLLQFVSLLEDVTSTYGDEGSNLCRLGKSLWALLHLPLPARQDAEALDPGDDPTALVTDFAVRVGAVAIAWFDKDNDVGENDIESVRDILTGWDGPGLDVGTPVVPSAADVVSQRMTSIALGGGFTGAGDDAEGAGTVMLTTAMVPLSQGGTSLFLALGGSTDIEQPLGRRWTFSAKVRADAGAAVLVGRQNRILGPATGAFEAGVAFTSHPPAPAPGDLAPPPTSFSFPSPVGTRLDVGQLAFALSLASDAAEMLLTIKDGAVVLDFGRQRRLHVRAPRRHAADPRLQPHLRLLEQARPGTRGQLLPSRPAGAARRAA